MSNINTVHVTVSGHTHHQHVSGKKAIIFPIFSLSIEDLNPSHFLNTLCMKRENQHIIRVYGHACNETEEELGSLSS